jgi:hypothetical protein
MGGGAWEGRERVWEEERQHGTHEKEEKTGEKRANEAKEIKIRMI